jgi:alkanesulfonate monooxygenase SsuD/methylene tetrahydromethanopterin reductase-like flavin-dependent oxidoreductase (luciferase family)
MRVLAFEQNPYRHLPDDFESRYESVVVTPYLDLVDGRRLHEDFTACVNEMVTAASLGLDGVVVTEHGQSSYDMSPNPTLPATVVAHQMAAGGRDVALGVIGRPLGKTREPLRIAEEYAVLDCISGGRLIAGFPVGLSYDANLNAGVPPVETRARYYEAHDLIKKAWSATEPFVWNGTYTQYRSVNPWPRPLQQPSPPVWVPTTGSPGTAAWVLDNDYVYTYLSWFGKSSGVGVMQRFYDIAESKGHAANPYRVAFLQVAAVGETDAEAEREYGPHLEYFFRKGIGSIPPEGLGLPGYVDLPGLQHLLRDPSDLGIYPQLRGITTAELMNAGSAIVGSAATVRDQLVDLVREFRIGNLLIMFQFGSLPHELVLKSMRLFSDRVLPDLHRVWEDEGWTHNWWPRGLPAPAPAAPAGGAP